MSARTQMAGKAGVTLSRNVTWALILIYVIQGVINVYLFVDRAELSKELVEKDVKIADLQREVFELQERLKIFNIIEDFQSGFTPMERDIIADVIYTQSKRLGYDPLLLLALIMTESSFRKGQQSYMGAMGLMQVKPSTGQWISRRYRMPWKGSHSLYEPRFNIKLGTTYLFELILKFRDVKKALVAYNIGENALTGKLRLKETVPERYVNKVIKKYHMLKTAYPDSLYG